MRNPSTMRPLVSMAIVQKRAVTTSSKKRTNTCKGEGNSTGSAIAHAASCQSSNQVNTAAARKSHRLVSLIFCFLSARMFIHAVVLPDDKLRFQSAAEMA